MKKPNFKRMKALFALERLSGPVQSDVLSDGSLASRYDIPIHRPVRLAEGVVVRQESVLQAFRNALTGGAAPELLSDDGDKVPATVLMESDGTGVIELEKSRVRFEYGGLIADDAARRRSVLESYLGRNTLATCYATELSQAIESPLSNEKFLRAATLMGTSLEKFAKRLQDKVKTGQVGESDLLPTDMRHWDHLTAPWVSSATLAEFIDKELTDERAARFGRNARYAMTSISLAFATSALVPLDILRKLEPDQVHEIVENLMEADDHLTLAGTFEICADWFARDKRFEALGERVLERLYGDLDRLQSVCTIFAAAFIVALARLAVLQPLQERPAYWRRLAAVAQASLVVRSTGVPETKQEDLVPWALRMCGKSYLVSACLDARTEPRWHADWIMPNFVAADVFGRTLGIVSSLPAETVPPGWTLRLETARQKLKEQKIETLMTFPSIAESVRRDRQPTEGDLGPLAEHYQNFANELSVEYLVFLSPLIYSFGFPAELTENLTQLMQKIRNEPSNMDNREVQIAVAIAAYVAVQINDKELADLVADVCLEKTTAASDFHSVMEGVCRLIQCAAADPEARRANLALARRLENLAFSIRSAELLTAFVDTLEVIKRTAPHLSQLLGRASAAARLGSVS